MLTYVKRLNEIEISFYNIARFIIVTLKTSSDRSPRASHQKVYLQTNHSYDTFPRQSLKCPSSEGLDCSKKIKGNSYFKSSSYLFLG